MIVWVFMLFEIVKRLFYRSEKNVMITTENDFSQSSILQDIFPDSQFIKRDSVEHVTFSPPVYVQRYVAVKETLCKFSKEHGGVEKVVDFGCAEMSFFLFYLKKIPGVQKVLCVDIDEDLLQRYYCKTLPLNVDYIDRRQNPLEVLVLSGSVDKSDFRLEDCDAVVAIELIEHLYPEALEELPYRIFGVIQPKIAIFTTPNEDFNVVFPNFSGFRHNDHKFEWTRNQFKDWAINICQRYPKYEVTFTGIGEGPYGTEKFGCCSQMATFILRSPSLKCDTSDLFSEVYKLVSRSEYPVDDTQPVSRELLSQVKIDEFIRYAYDQDEFLNDECLEIPLERLFNFITQTCSSMEELRKLLLSKGRKIGMNFKGKEVLTLPVYGLSDESSCHSNYCEETDSCWEETESPNNVLKGTNYEYEEDWDESQVLPSQPMESGISSPFFDSFSGDCVPGTSQLAEKTITSRGSYEKGKEETKLGRCHSLEEIKCGTSKKLFRRSLCCDEKSWDINLDRRFHCHESISADELPGSGCWSVSRAGDSGYPNSSEQMDLTPEQVDEIIGDSSQDEDEDEEAPGAADMVRWGQDMENGDVANNNRDWEGNNMEGQPMLGEPIVFEHVIDHPGFQRPNQEGAPLPHPDIFQQPVSSTSCEVKLNHFLRSGYLSPTARPSSADTSQRVNLYCSSSCSFCIFPSSSPDAQFRAFDPVDPQACCSLSGSSHHCPHVNQSLLSFQSELLPVRVRRSSSSLNVECSSSEASYDCHEDFPTWLLHLFVDSRESLYDGDDEGPEHIVEGDLLGGGEPGQIN